MWFAYIDNSISSKGLDGCKIHIQLLYVIESMLLKLPLLILEGIGVLLVLKIMGKEAVYYLVEDIGLTPAIVLLDLNPCEAVLAILS